jgi:HAD superfamily hydrolase (TIGR01490 family)
VSVTLTNIHDKTNKLKTNLAREIAIKNALGTQLHLPPSAVTMSIDGRSCLNLPLNLFNLDATNRISIDGLSWETLYYDWQERMSGYSGLTLDIALAAVRRFVRRVVLVDPVGYSQWQGKPVLYMGNHQTGIESLLFLCIVISLGQIPAGAIAKQEHRDSWVGLIHQLTALEMGVNNPVKMLFFNRAQPRDMLKLLHDFSSSLTHDPFSLLIHTDGTRAQTAFTPVQGVSSVLINFAIAQQLPIIPVRFAGGLPIESNGGRLDFPQQMGQQDYYLGQAILPQTLQELTHAQRSQWVLDSINSLGTTGEIDLPLQGDAVFNHKVEMLRSNGYDEVQSVLRTALSELPIQSKMTQQLLTHSNQPSSDMTSWLAAQLLGGHKKNSRFVNLMAQQTMQTAAFDTNSVAIFDVDGTLCNTRSSSGQILIWLRQSQHSAWRHRVWLLSLGWRVPVIWLADKINRNLAERMIYSQFAGLSLKKMLHDTQQCCDEVLLPACFSDALTELELHRRAGRRIIFLSGGIDIVLKPLANALGAELLAQRLIAKNDCFTGRYLSLNEKSDSDNASQASRKLAALQNYAKMTGIDLASSFAYGDSINDAKMLGAVGHPVAINPDKGLARLAAKRGWVVRRWD